MDNQAQVQADSHILINSKLLAYEEMVLAKQKYIRIAKIQGRVDFRIEDWILSIINFYDVMFSETQEETYAAKYKEVFAWIPLFESGKIPQFETINRITRNLMVFAQEVGITQTKKLGTEIHY